MKKRRQLIACAVALFAGVTATRANETESKQTDQTMNANKKTLVVYFSRTGENYSVGHITKGNTEIVAEIIAQQTGAELFEIKPVKAYPEVYRECTDQAQDEANADARPAVVGDIRVEDYDTIFVGYPIWWGDMPMPVYTFLEKHDWTGKTVVPFCTNEGSGLGVTESSLRRTCKGASVLRGLAVRGTTAQNNREAATKSVADWLQKVGF
ncbi:MAG: flavodoxin [Sutterellaceae bacterium]|nr:flavodoxin [Sutterellaceae bacterium]